MFICDKFNVSLNYIETSEDEDRELIVKDYTFMLILPKFVIKNKIEAVNNEV